MSDGLGLALATSLPLSLAGGSPPFINTKSLLLDGVNERADVGNVFDYDAYSVGRVFSAWVKPTTLAGNRSIMSKQSNVDPWPGWSITAYSGLTGSVRFEYMSSPSDRVAIRTTNAVLTVGVWAHVLINHDGGDQVEIWIDGVNQPLTTINNSLSSAVSTATVMGIGARDAGASEFFGGNLEETSIFNGTFNASEVAETYNGGTPGDLYLHSRAGDGLWWLRNGDDPSDDATGTTGTIIDQFGANDATPYNTEAGDFVTDTP